MKSGFRCVTVGTLVLLLVSALTATAASKKASWKMPEAPEGVSIEKDIAYLPAGREEKLDLYKPAKRGPDVKSPAVVIIHGGGWTGGDKGAEREFITGTT